MVNLKVGSTVSLCVDPLISEILRTVRYFAFFEHPLTEEEVQRYLRIKADVTELRKALQEAVAEGRLFFSHDYYAAAPAHIDKRRRSPEVNRKLLRAARRMGRLMRFFPFVRGAYISGSLSKGDAKPGDDIDFFIITAPKRLWTAKLFLILFKKVFLLNSHRYFCINFLKSEDDLTIAKRNIYTATEAVSLIPVYNPALLTTFFRANSWVGGYFPNFRPPACSAEHRRFFPADALLGGRLGQWLEAKAFQKFRNHTESVRSRKESGDFTASPTTSAFFPNSPERRILAHYQSEKGAS